MQKCKKRIAGMQKCKLMPCMCTCIYRLNFAQLFFCTLSLFVIQYREKRFQPRKLGTLTYNMGPLVIFIFFPNL